MSVLAREAASYQSAVDQYQRLAQGFNNSLLRDASGNVLVLINGQYFSVPAQGGQATLADSFTTSDGRTLDPTQLAQYGSTQSPGDPNVMLVRQNPTSSAVNTVSGLSATSDESGNVTYYTALPDGGSQIYRPPPGAVVTYTLNPPTTEGGTPMYTATEMIYQYPGEPPAFTKKAPDPTNAQLRRANQGSWADAERMAGLETGIIRGAGLKGGLRPPPLPAGSVQPLPGQPAPAPVIDDSLTNQFPSGSVN